jgi:hypothetical protein
LKKREIFDKDNENRIFVAVSTYLAVIAPNKHFEEKEKACVVLLIFPMFGPSSTTYNPKSSGKSKPARAGTTVYALLGQEGMERYKETITVYNSAERREKLFSDEIGNSAWRKLWPFIRDRLTPEMCLPVGQIDLLKHNFAYCSITKEIQGYGL